jgi:multisubunit Na+/H+ antiporter MnhB subunit
MGESGVGHPVTAVLLNFRGYDTLLEVAVLLVAAVAVRAIQPHGARREAALSPNLLASFVSLLVPISVLVAGYFLWRGSDGPGGAFQSASILAGCAVVLVLSGRVRAPGNRPGIRAALLVGPCLFVLIAGVPLLAGAHLLEYPRQWAGALLLVLETGLAISIAIILTTFFAPSQKHERQLHPGGGGS